KKMLSFDCLANKNMSSQLLVSQMEKKIPIVASFLAAGKGRAISFTLDPEQEAEIMRHAKLSSTSPAYFEVEQLLLADVA
ncbi:hypothetical protein HDU99_010839, partial [Rhizoclosmatium hyalinum]